MKKSNFYKGCLEPLVLKLLNDNGRMYGYEMTQKVKEMTVGELTITEGALYPLLHRLEADGILSTEVENIGNRPRKYYKLTEKGEKQKSHALEELQNFMRTMQLLLHPQTI
ncbi:MAG: PadR family transcriptional regulator [Chitinophagaceae bacterium]